MSRDNAPLATALRELAETYSRSPINVIGQSIHVDGTNAPPGSRIVGSSIVVQGGGGGTVIGQRIVVNAGNTDALRAQRQAEINELLEASKAVASGNAQKSWIMGLLQRIQPYADHALKAALSKAGGAAIDYFSGS